MDGVCRSGFGVARQLASLPAGGDGLVVVLLQITGLQSDDQLASYPTLAAAIAAGNREATFVNYGRIVYSTPATQTWDAVNLRWKVALPTTPTWTNAGSSLAPQALGKLLVCYDPALGVGDDTTLAPLTHHDYLETAGGGTLDRPFPDGGVFYRPGRSA